MRSRARGAAALLVALALVAGCGSVPEDGPSLSPTPTPVPATPPPATEPPFAPAAWPERGSACAEEGYSGRLGRIEAPNPRTVRFTLCAPDAAFPARLADPALGVIDASAVAAAEDEPGERLVAAGAGSFRVEAWTERDNVRLERVAGASGEPGPVPPGIVVLRWAASSPSRTTALRDAEVDGIDDPGARDVADLEVLPELVVLPRPGLATAYLGFGSGRAFNDAAVRVAIAQGLDHAALARDAFPAGSEPATHTTPCSVPSGCVGLPWHEFNGPAGTAALGLAGFDSDTPMTLTVPDSPVPGLPDPATAGAAVEAALEENLGLRVRLQEQPADELAAAIAAGDLAGLYLWGVSSILADPSGFLEPLFGPEATGTAARRGRDVRAALEAAASAPDEAARRAAFSRANDAVRSAAPIVPLVHPGSSAAYRADVQDVAISPLGLDPLGRMVPGDRRQLVVMGVDEPAGTWCGAASLQQASRRLCALVTPGLYAFTDGSLLPRPVLAQRCDPEDGFTTWTCRLREDLRFDDGKRVDAGDVLASFRAQGDATGPLRTALPADAFAAWDELFGAPLP